MIVLSSLNSQYVHTNLAIRYLAAVAEQNNENVRIAEFTINEDADSIVRRIYAMKPDVIGFSCYIWNIELTAKVMEDLKKANPDLYILAGGPEVSFDTNHFMSNYPFVDAVVRGEGEAAFADILDQLKISHDLSGITGVTWRRGHEIVENPSRPLINDLNKLPSPYSVIPDNGRILYYESSRGCPFKCSYCLSSAEPGVRYLPIERVKQELCRLDSLGVKQVKLVDRSFNCNQQRALEIMTYLAELPGNTCFHFEIIADLITDEMLEFLKSVKKGRFQFEIGIQSINEKTLLAVNRKQDHERAAYVIKELMSNGNIHIHLDLIAGLPFEDLGYFAASFNWLYGLLPDYLQLGFLKLLKGSPLREEADRYGYIYKAHPPYEVIKNPWLSYSDICLLKIIEDLIQRYYNSGAFQYTLEFCEHELYPGNPFEMYSEAAKFWEDNGLIDQPMARSRLYGLWLRAMGKQAEELESKINDLLVLDFIINNVNLELPESLNPNIYEEIPLKKAVNAIPTDGFCVLAEVETKKAAKPRVISFKSDILATAGMKGYEERPSYYTVFKWEDSVCKVRYIDL
ncbi:MAG: DUF4080 domain-containing protein [Candidatus Saccharibacteria bacterium]